MKNMDEQIGGSHYKGMKMQPTEFIMLNDIPFVEGNIIKYVCRHRLKNGAEDLKKALHYIKILLESEYNESDILQERVQQERTALCTRNDCPRTNQIGPVANHD